MVSVGAFVEALFLTTEHSIITGGGIFNESIAVPGGSGVMVGFRSDDGDGTGFALIDVSAGEIDQWYITDPNYNNEYHTMEGGGYAMTCDTENNTLYAILYSATDLGQEDTRFGIINLTSHNYSDWLDTPFRKYNDIVYDRFTGTLFLTVPNEDAIVEF